MSNELEAKKIELIQKVNAVTKGNLFGTDELEEVAGLFFEVCEEIEKSNEGNKPTILSIASQLGIPLYTALNGVDVAIAQAMDLQDEEILNIVSLGDSYNLGENAVHYKQILKLFLFGFQTYSVFA